MLICGIDEAGRGPILGPLVMAGILIEEKEASQLDAIGITDSKLLTPEQRDLFFTKIKKIVKNHLILSIPPQEVDEAVNGKDGLNLNTLEAKKTIEIINELNPDNAILDCPSTNTRQYKDLILSKIKNKKIIVVCEHKADLNYVAVGAASILAKVTRDKEIGKIKKEIKIDFGSGYLSDPKTKKFLVLYVGYAFADGHVHSTMEHIQFEDCVSE